MGWKSTNNLTATLDFKHCTLHVWSQSTLNLLRENSKVKKSRLSLAALDTPLSSVTMLSVKIKKRPVTNEMVQEHQSSAVFMFPVLPTKRWGRYSATRAIEMVVDFSSACGTSTATVGASASGIGIGIQVFLIGGRESGILNQRRWRSTCTQLWKNRYTKRLRHAPVVTATSTATPSPHNLPSQQKA